MSGRSSVGGGRVWISEASAPKVHVFDAVSAREIDTFEMPRNPFFDAIQGLAWGAGDFWVSHGPNDISQVDPVSFEIRTSIASEALDHLRFADDLLWVVDRQGAVIKIDPARRTEVGRTSDLGRVSDLEVGGGYAWAAQPGSGTVVRIDGGMDTTTFPAQVSVQSLSFDAFERAALDGELRLGLCLAHRPCHRPVDGIHRRPWCAGGRRGRREHHRRRHEGTG